MTAHPTATKITNPPHHSTRYARPGQKNPTNDPINLESGRLFYTDLLRDGGSAIVIIDMPTPQISLRVMRSIAE